VIFTKKTWITLSQVVMTVCLTTSSAIAGPTDDILLGYMKEAQKTDKSIKEFDAGKGKDFYHAKQTLKDGKTISCATCHTADPKMSGKTRAGKSILPMAPAANPQRFTDKAKVEKWFKRNCMDVYERNCTPSEKGHFIKYLQSIK